jgi:hypothetical protein
VGLPRSIDRRRLGQRCGFGALAVLAIVQVYRQASASEYGYDFRGGTWSAGRALLHGRSPFPVPHVDVLLAHSNSFITPPPLAVLGAPLSLLSFVPAIVVFNVLCVVALLATMWLLDAWRPAFVLAVLASFPFVASICMGQPDALFALGCAVAWRWRDKPVGAVAVAVIIAAKLLAWPLILWFLVTRRLRQAAIASLAALVLLGGSWALVGFGGLASYPRLLSADATAFGAGSHSILTGLVRLGMSLHLAMAFTVPLAIGAAALVVWGGRRTDLAWFTAALALGILASPVVWQHYLLLLFVPLAVSGHRDDPFAWALILALWLSPVEPPPTAAQAWLVPVVATALAVRVARLAGHRPADTETVVQVRPPLTRLSPR